MQEFTPFNRPSCASQSYRYVAEAMQSAHHSGDGPFTKWCNKFLKEATGSKSALLTTSCTHALEMAAILLEIRSGDEVIVPSFNFASAANAFISQQGRPVFVDVRADTLNIDEQLIEKAITKRTKAIVVVHYAGVSADMEAIMKIARKYGIAVVEDNAHGLFGRFKGKPLGSFGDLATLSFHETKNVSCGEGGALLINKKKFITRAEIIREKGTDRTRFFRGEVRKYRWVDYGSSYLPSDILAALLRGQLENSKKTQARRKRIFQIYDNDLSHWADANGITRPDIPNGCDPAWHIYFLRSKNRSIRDQIISDLRRSRVMSVFHYSPLHKAPYARKLGIDGTTCPVAEKASETLFRLPMWNEMSEQVARKVAKILTSLDF